jgi:nicotinamide-nucleotide amidase
MFKKDAGIPSAELVVIGNEVTSGLVLDTNSQYICNRLLTVGIDVCRITAIGDTRDYIVSAINQALSRVDIVITSGGLGATHDDITKQVLAEMFESGFKKDPVVEEMVSGVFRARGQEVPPQAFSQWEVPEKAEILYNEKGTAPGFLFRRHDKRVYVLPGVPHEMEHLMGKYILPQLAPLGRVKIGHRIIKTTGVSESGLWGKIGPVEPLEQFVTVASLPSHFGVRIRLSAWGETQQEVDLKLASAEKLLQTKVAEHIYGRDDEDLEVIVGGLLRENNLRLAVAESCTGGLIGHRLTNISGSSDYFIEGVVTYSNDAKANRLGVGEDLLARCGAVSREVALAMADGVRKTAGADIGLAVTGIAGPTGATPQKPLGLTFIAVSDKRNSHCEQFQFHQDRVRNKERAAQAALNLLRQWLAKMGS